MNFIVSENRINWIDYAKTIGIALVVYGHIRGAEGAGIIFLFHMPFFFILSGYLYKPRPIKEEWSKVLWSLVIPYLIFNAILLLITPPESYNDAIYILLGNQEHLPNNYRPMWFLVSLAMMRLISSVSRDKLWLSAIITFAIYLFLYYFKCLLHEWDLFQICTTLLCYQFFAFGYYLNNNKRIDILGGAKWKVLVFSVLMFPIFLVIGYYNSANSGGHLNVFNCETGCNIFIFLLVAYMLSYILIKLSELFINKSSKIIQMISMGTVLILCLHQTALDVLSYFFDITIVYVPVLMTILVMVFSFPLIWVSEMYCPVLIGKRK